MPEPANPERAIDEVCDRFEARWRAGQPPAIEDYLGAVPEAARDELLRELLRLEIDYRRRRGEQPALGDYLPRWPQRNALLEELLGEVLPAPRPAVARPVAPGNLEWTGPYMGTLPENAAGGSPSSDERITRVLPPEAAAPALARQVGRYRVVRPLRQGATGTVYLAEDAPADRLVAIQVPNFGPGSSPTALERFRRAARAAARLAHPNLCPIFEVGEWQGIPFLVMPYLPLPSLADRLKEGWSPAPPEAAELVGKLARAMQAAHRAGVVHRDLNPSCILLDPGVEPVVVDFGLALSVETTSRLTQTGEVLGAPAYIAPEQLSGNPEAQGPGCDVFSLGVILYELLTGEMPFGRTLQEVLLRIMTRDPVPPSALRPEVGPELDTVCRKALACKVRQRFRSMGELAEALQGPPAHREHSPGRRGRLLVPALLVGIALAGAVYFLRNDRGEIAPDPGPTTPAAVAQSDRKAESVKPEGKKDEATPPPRKDNEAEPKNAADAFRIAWDLDKQGKRTEAERAYRKVLELDPRHHVAHNNLGIMLATQGQDRWAEAEEHLRKAVEIDPKFALAYRNLAWMLDDLQGRCAEAAKAYRQALAAQDNDWARGRLVRAERLGALEPKLPGLLKGEYAPKDSERLDFAELCHFRQLYRTTARLYAEAFAAEPKMADDLAAGHRFQATCHAALAACGKGEDAAGLDEQEKTRLRRQALGWLKADLALWGKRFESGNAANRAQVQVQMRNWLNDTSLAGVRDGAALAGLPKPERQEWQQLWADVTVLHVGRQPAAR